MPLDLSHPRHLVPASRSPNGSGHRRAVHLKLTEDVLRQLLDIVAPATKPGGGEHKVAGGQIMVNVDGPQPVLVVGGISHPLSVVPEAADTTLVRLSPASRDLVPVATVSHRATAQHRPADLDKAGQRARENREQVERAKEARKAVLLDEPPVLGNGSNSNKKRSASNPRPRQLGAASASASSTPNPPSAPSSRLASPAIPASPSLAAQPTSSSTSISSTVRHPSRLTAVPQTAASTVSTAAATTTTTTSRPPVGPSGTFRIGKGAVPASLSRSGSASSASSSSSGGSAIPLAAITAQLPISQLANGGRTSEEAGRADVAANRAEESKAILGAVGMELDPSRPSPSTEPAATFPSKHAGTTTERESLPLGTDGEALASKSDHKPIRPGGGGLMKGKESLKKEKRREERQRERPAPPTSAPAAAASAAAAPPKADDSSKAVAVKPTRALPKGVNANKIKSEAFVNDSDDEMSEVDADGEADADGEVDDDVMSEAPPSNAVAATKPAKSTLPRKLGKDSPPERKKRRLDEPVPKPVRKSSVSSKSAVSPKVPDKPLKRLASVESISAVAAVSKDSGSEATITAGARPKKRKKEAVKRWYSSSSDEDDADTTDRDRKVKSKNGDSLNGARLEAPAKTASSEKLSTVDVAAGPRVASRMSYLEAYAAYAELYARLAAERAALEQGSAGPLLQDGGDPGRVKRMIDELSEKRRALEALHTSSTRLIPT